MHVFFHGPSSILIILILTLVNKRMQYSIMVKNEYKVKTKGFKIVISLFRCLT